MEVIVTAWQGVSSYRFLGQITVLSQVFI